MSREQLALRLLSSETGINPRPLQTGFMEETDWSKIARVMNDMASARMWVDDSPTLSVMELRTKTRRLEVEQHGLDLVIVDYLQLMQGEGRSENRVQEVSYISRNLKALARELNVPVLAGAQLSRAVEQRTDKRPILSDLRESGSLEQDSDIVMFIHRPDMYEREAGRTNLADIIVAKHRNGPTDDIQLVFRGALTKFENAVKVDLRNV